MRIATTLLTALLVMGCQNREKPGTATRALADASAESTPSAGVRRCPNGHTTIKLVPITYGKIAITPELREKEANYEVAFGGCDMNSLGKFKIVCTTCGAHTYEGRFPWYDKTTRVIPSGNTITGTRVAEQTDGGNGKPAPQP